MKDDGSNSRGTLQASMQANGAPRKDKSHYLPFVLHIHQRSDLTERQKQVFDATFQRAVVNSGEVSAQGLADKTGIRRGLILAWITTGPLIPYFEVTARPDYFRFRALKKIPWDWSPGGRRAAGAKTKHASVPLRIAEAEVWRGAKGRTALCVYAMLRYRTNGRVWCEISDAELCERLGVRHPRTVAAARAKLVDLGLVRVEYRGRIGHRYLMRGVADNPLFMRVKR